MIRCLHGAVGCAANWSSFADRLGEEIDAVDLWELLEEGSKSLAEAGEEIAYFSDPGDVLLGYSMGGRIALHALLAAPEKWRAAVMVSAHPGLIEGHRERLENDAIWAKRAETDWDDFLQKWQGQEILTSSSIDSAPASRQREVARSFRDWSLGGQENLLPSFPEITCPVLWITGEEDLRFTVLARTAVAQLPDANHHVIAKAGHRTPWQRAEEFCRIVRDFVTDERFTK